MTGGPQTGTLYWLPRILADQTLDATSTLLMVGLADHVNADDECFVGIQRLADYARCSYGTARRKLAALETMGVIVRSIRHRSDGGRSVYDYRLVRTDPPAQSDMGGARTVRGAPRAPGRAEPPAHQDARTEPPLVEPPHVEPTTRVEQGWLAHGFEEFWAAYPRNTAKGEARKAWPAAVKAAGGMTMVVEGAARYRDDPNRDPGYTAHAATWLRGERWNDDPLPPRHGSGPSPRQQRKADAMREFVGDERPTGAVAAAFYGFDQQKEIGR